MYEEIRAIIDIETSIVSESALSISKNKIVIETWIYICPLRSNKLKRKGNSYILYCKYCLPEMLYSSLVIINFCYHFANKYNIIIKKR